MQNSEHILFYLNGTFKNFLSNCLKLSRTKPADYSVQYIQFKSRAFDSIRKVTLVNLKKYH